MVALLPPFVLFGRPTRGLSKEGTLKKIFRRAGLAVALAILGAAPASALSVRESNVVDLLSEANDIVVGKVQSVTDGLNERGIPFTEVTMAVSESIRGQISGTYRFRQFGLLKPRPMADGRTMMPAPEGFPRYTPGEEVVLFLRPSAAWTGFRMPAGVSQGKFVIGPGRVANEMGNASLYRNVRLEKGLASAREGRMMDDGGAANPETFLTFVRRAVRERWVETGRMSRIGMPGVLRAPAPSEPNAPHGERSTATTTVKGTSPGAPQTSLDPNDNSALTGIRR
jgi:hypothetical protein